MERTDDLKTRIVEGLGAERVEVRDDSEQHRGHAGARGGARHYSVVVVAERFAGLDRVSRHRAVYEAVGDMIPTQVHALVISAFTPAEWSARAAPQ